MEYDVLELRSFSGFDEFNANKDVPEKKKLDKIIILRPYMY